MKEILETIILNLVENKESVEVKEKNENDTIVYEVKVAEGDMGKVIGRQGRLARSIRAVIKAAANKEKKKVSVEFLG